TLNDSAAAQKIYDALPIEASANRWGKEIYFPIPVNDKLDDAAREEMAVGELGYWPPGKAFCIFFGPTPASQGNEPRAASPVNVIGEVTGDATVCDGVPDGMPIRIEKAAGE
ncbi:MAG: cyclophilin-like fold protein, partial [Phycisphaerae bacterium]|nr:cyclophilin-like fold protein [Phycisphaerae bacterium]